MSNLITARIALLAELRHAQQGMKFYATRMETVEKLLAQLDGVDAEDDSPKSAIGRKKPLYKRAALIDAAPHYSVPTVGKVSLPATRGDFWKNLVTELPMSNKDILQAAITTLKIRPNPASLKKLKQRLANALTLMTKDGSLTSDGSGRARRFSCSS